MIKLIFFALQSTFASTDLFSYEHINTIVNSHIIDKMHKDDVTENDYTLSLRIGTGGKEKVEDETKGLNNLNEKNSCATNQTINLDKCLSEDECYKTFIFFVNEIKNSMQQNTFKFTINSYKIEKNNKKHIIYIISCLNTEDYEKNFIVWIAHNDTLETTETIVNDYVKNMKNDYKFTIQQSKDSFIFILKESLRINIKNQTKNEFLIRKAFNQKILSIQKPEIKLEIYKTTDDKIICSSCYSYLTYFFFNPIKKIRCYETDYRLKMSYLSQCCDDCSLVIRINDEGMGDIVYLDDGTTYESKENYPKFITNINHNKDTLVIKKDDEDNDKTAKTPSTSENTSIIPTFQNSSNTNNH